MRVSGSSLLLLAALLLASLSLSTPLRAQTCTVTPTTPINFGAVDVLLNTAVDITGNVSVNCTGTASRTVRVCLNMGDPNAGTVGGLRIAKSGANNLSYQFYSDAARTVKWSSWKTGGAGVEVLVVLNASGIGTAVNKTIYGRVFAGQQTVPPGTYTAAFTSTLTHVRSRYTTTGQLCPAMTAGTLSWPLSMSATVPTKCVVTSATLNFGAPTSLGTLIDASTNLGVSCSVSLPFQIALNGGVSAATDPTFRKMTKAAEFVRYGLYRDTARTLAWGSTLGSNTYSGTGTGLSIAVPVYGRVPVQTTPTPGLYADTVVITVNY